MPSAKTNIKIHCHVGDKTIIVSCGSGKQRLRWLGNVALSRWDDESFQGWRSLGVPSKILRDGNEMDLGSSVKDVLEDGMEIHVVPSMTIPTYERAGLNTVDQIDCEGDAAIGAAEGV
ncbi:hypothetical protein TrCOL_g7976 [Triparma columacea]|uniref:Par3/HAL N-terminal domain-containing protein n=1 Tax=Triparma columacea TaxID=722753 RepID=A0A9W7GAM0_9STRA|nr:hypothetical protein TrCOL_g7976 [Triparma columacea]